MSIVLALFITTGVLIVALLFYKLLFKTVTTYRVTAYLFNPETQKMLPCNNSITTANPLPDFGFLLIKQRLEGMEFGENCIVNVINHYPVTKTKTLRWKHNI